MHRTATEATTSESNGKKGQEERLSRLWKTPEISLLSDLLTFKTHPTIQLFVIRPTLRAGILREYLVKAGGACPAFQFWAGQLLREL